MRTILRSSPSAHRTLAPVIVTNGSGNRIAPLLTVQEACAYLKCTRRYVERMVRTGRLRALKPSGKLVRLRQVDLDAFLESGATIEGVE
jgi:excisionase family DNA binding protein